MSNIDSEVIQKITQAQLMEVLHYNPVTGFFTWIVTRSNNVIAGDIAGCKDNIHGTVLLRIYGILYRASHLAWLYTHNKWPENEIDHIDHDPSNNAILNLRDVSHSVNMKNLSIANNTNEPPKDKDNDK